MFPPKCVCCGAEATTVYRPSPPARPKGLPAPENPLELPYCEACHSNLIASHWLATRKLVALNIAIWGVALVMMAKLPLWISVVPLLLGGGTLLWAMKAAQKATSQVEGAAGMDVVVRCLWHRRGTYVFSFAREPYAREFEKLNASALTPDPELK